MRALLVLALLAGTAAAAPGKLTYTDKAMGTYVTVWFWTDREADAAKAARSVFDEMRRLDAEMTTWTKDGETAKINAAAGVKPVKVSDEELEVIERAVDISKRSGGVFDITVEAFRGLWKFDEDMDYTLPDPADVKKRLAKIGWKDIVIEVHAQYPDVELDHMYVDNAAMQLVKAPKKFDVVVTGNMFGDILSDEAAMLTGSIGMLPSASLNESSQGLYEPSHGSAPDIAGKGIANPLATILSAAMLLRYSLNEAAQADRIEAAVRKVLSQGLRTADIFEAGTTKVSTSQMGDAVLKALA